jgi:hypothetical protein
MTLALIGGDFPMKVIDVKNVLSPAIAGLMLSAGVAVASAQDVIIAPEQEHRHPRVRQEEAVGVDFGAGCRVEHWFDTAGNRRGSQV